MFALVPDTDTPAGPYLVGDNPPAISAAIVDEDGQELDVSTLSTVSGVVVAPAGLATPLVSPALDELTDRVTWGWPDDALVYRGIHTVEVVVTAAGVLLSLDPLPVVVEGTDGWLSLAMARRLWPDAPPDDVALFLILESARTACQAYAPDLPAGEQPPANWVQAQLIQARSVWNLMQTSPQTADAIGLDAYAIRVYPLDYNVRQLLRPKSGKPVMW